MIETPRLLLKKHTLDNLESLKKWFNDPELCFYDDDEPFRFIPGEAIWEMLQEMIQKGPDSDGTVKHFAIHLKSTDALIGYCMIAMIDRHNRRCSLGLTIGSKHEWNKGYAREVLIGLLAFCYCQLNMHRIEAEIFSFNLRSIRLFESAGFKREGIRRESVWKSGSFFDAYQYGLLEHEWRSGQSVKI